MAVQVYSSKSPVYVRVLEILVIVLVGGITAYLSTVRVNEIVAGEGEVAPVEAAPAQANEQFVVTNLAPPPVEGVRPPAPPVDAPQALATPAAQETEEEVAPTPIRTVKPATKVVKAPAPAAPAPIAITPQPPRAPVISQNAYSLRPFQAKGFKSRGFNKR